MSLSTRVSTPDRVRDPDASHHTRDTASAREWHARLELGFALRDGRTRLVHNLHQGPLRLIRELQADDGSTCHAVIVHPPGGLVAGDTLALHMRVGAGARVLATTPGAQKWYRGEGRSASAAVSIEVGDDATLEWLPQPAIVFDAAGVDQSVTIELAASARAIGWECLVLGRTAMGERFVRGNLHQRLELRIAGRPVWCEQVAARAGERLFDSPLGWDGHTVGASFWVAGDPAVVDQDLVRILRDDLDARGGLHAGVTCLAPGVVVAKLLADDSERAMAAAERLWTLARPRALGAAATPPRIWAT